MTRTRTEKWSGEVARHGDALDLDADIFKSDDPARIAASLKHQPRRRPRSRRAAAARSSPR